MHCIYNFYFVIAVDLLAVGTVFPE